MTPTPHLTDFTMDHLTPVRGTGIRVMRSILGLACGGGTNFEETTIAIKILIGKHYKDLLRLKCFQIRIEIAIVVV